MHSLLSRMDNHMTDGNNSHELMRFIRVDDSTRRILREAAPHLTPLLPMALDQFYEQLRGFPQVSRFFFQSLANELGTQPPDRALENCPRRKF